MLGVVKNLKVTTNEPSITALEILRLHFVPLRMTT